MSDFIPIQASIFGATILCGIGMGVIYDSIRIFRRIVPHNNFVIAIEDLIYWICCSIFLFYVLYSKDDGVIRGFSILGVMVGLCIYYISISKAYVKATVWTINKIKNFILALIKLLTAPIRFIYNFLKKFTRKPRKYVVKQLKKPIKQVKISKGRYKLKKQLIKYEKKLMKEKKIEQKRLEVIKIEQKRLEQKSVNKKDLRKKTKNPKD
ncbi:MAG: hypothetical protein K0R15_831 [Clostridiales bacterium]|jgi:spore cortex biosynthesis protein YabQ|nr:hypothetical protein [Bacillales bacterium]MDF2820390.1 hypothetical protein [Clostridiales bacterium]